VFLCFIYLVLGQPELLAEAYANGSY